MARPAKRAEKAEPTVSRETSEPEASSAKPRKALPYPRGLGTGGRLLWREVTIAHHLDITQRVTLEEACRAKDRLDDFDQIIQGKGVLELMHFRIPHAFVPGLNGELQVEVKFDAVIANANQTANLMKQLLAALRLPDASGARPQQRGGARGAYVSGGADSGADKPGTGSGSTLGNLRGITGGRSA
jgi:hypothetical protein